jgi:hypothetical protein
MIFHKGNDLCPGFSDCPRAKCPKRAYSVCADYPYSQVITACQIFGAGDTSIHYENFSLVDLGLGKYATERACRSLASIAYYHYD